MEKSKKSLGQNFLLNKEKIKEIVGALDIKSGDVVVEIGPGHGELTKELITNDKLRIIAIEKDEGLVEKLGDEMKKHGDKIEIIAGDALKMLPDVVSGYGSKTSYKLIGNIPYYITGFLLRTISELEHKPKITVLTVQKEVAKRICGEMNLLSASVRYWAEPEIIGIIPKSDFSPQPKVDSAIIRLKTINKKRETGDEAKSAENYHKFIKILFKQPRKTILNNLLGMGKNKVEIEKILKENSIDHNSRAQNLNVSQIRELARIFTA